MVTIRTLVTVAALALSTQQATAQTNLSVAWRLCEQHGHLIGRPSQAAGPARWVFQQGYGGCETIQKMLPEIKMEARDPNEFILNQMLIEKAIKDPNGSP